MVIVKFRQSFKTSVQDQRSRTQLGTFLKSYSGC